MPPSHPLGGEPRRIEPEPLDEEGSHGLGPATRQFLIGTRVAAGIGMTDERTWVDGSTPAAAATASNAAAASGRNAALPAAKAPPLS